MPAAYIPAAPDSIFFDRDRYSPVSPISYKPDSIKWPAFPTTDNAFMPPKASQSSMDTQRTSGYLEPSKHRYPIEASPHLEWLEPSLNQLPLEASVELPGVGSHLLPTTDYNLTYPDYSTVNDPLTNFSDVLRSLRSTPWTMMAMFTSTTKCTRCKTTSDNKHATAPTMIKFNSS